MPERQRLNKTRSMLVDFTEKMRGNSDELNSSRVFGSSRTENISSPLRVPRTMNPMSLGLYVSHISLWVLWSLCSFISFASQVLADVFQGDAPEFPFGPTLVSATFLLVAAAVVSTILGYQYYYPYYQVYQPFTGGQRFVALQAVGWGVLTSCVMCNLVCLMSDEKMLRNRYGFLSTVGCVALFANGCLVGSLWRFNIKETVYYLDRQERKKLARREASGSVEPSSEASSSSAYSKLRNAFTFSGQVHRLARSPNRETALVLVFLAANLLLCTIASCFKVLAAPAVTLAAVFYVVDGWLLHFVIGWKYKPGYRLFMPILRSPVATCGQVALWVMHVLTFYLYVGVVHAKGDVPPITLGILTIASFTSTAALLLFIRSGVFDDIPQERSVIALYGGSVLSATSCAVGCGVFGVAVFLRQHGLATLCRTHQRKDNESLTDLAMCNPRTEALLLCQTISALLMLLLPVFTHLTGRIIFGNDFGFFQPFQGSRTFIVMQALGWACFGFSVLSIALHMTAESFTNILTSATLSIMSQFLLQASIQAYQNHSSTGKRSSEEGMSETSMSTLALPTEGKGNTTTESSPKSDSSPLSSLASSVNVEEQETGLDKIINGAMITSYLLGFSSIILRLVVDVAYIGDWSLAIHSRLLLTISVVLFSVCVPLAHYSGKDHGVPLFRPFSGSGSYIALQAIGWTLYATIILTSAIVGFLDLNNFDFASFFPEHKHPLFWYTLEGGLQLVPLTLITLSVLVESRNNLSVQHKKQLALESFAVLQSFLSQLEEKDANVAPGIQKEELLVALHVIGDSAMRHLDMSLEDILHSDSDDSESSGSSSGSASDTDSDGDNVWARRTRSRRLEKKGKTQAAAAAAAAASAEGGDATGKATSSTNLYEMMMEQTTSMLNFSSDTSTRQGAATILVLLLSIASAATYSVAALFSSTLPTLGAAFATIGFSVSTVSCVAVHCVYGLILHGHTGKYSFFMPFTGGQKFVALQIVGWVAYAVTAIVTLISMLEPYGYPIALIFASCTSVSSQLCIISSIPMFKPKARPHSFIENNAEGIVALLTFAGAISFAHLYSEAKCWLLLDEECLNALADGADAMTPYSSHVTRFLRRITELSTANEFNRTGGIGGRGNSSQLVEQAMVFQRNRVPFVVAAISIALAVPLIIIGFNRLARRSAALYRIPADHFASVGGSEADLSTTQRNQNKIRRQRRNAKDQSTWFVAVHNTLQTLSLLSITFTPLFLLFFGYYVMENYDVGILRIVRVWWPPLGLMLATLLALSMLLSLYGDSSVASFMRGVRCTLITFLTYNIATVSVLISFVPMLTLPFYSVGAYYFAFNICSLTVFAGIKPMRKALKMGVFAMIGYVTYNHASRLYYEGLTMAYVKDFYQFVIDMAALWWWVWYMPLYHGEPHETGAHRSMAFTNFGRKSFFAECCRYFNFKMIVDDPELVNMRDGSKQFLFSFHPHGVFPGTALFAPLTEEWERKVGLNDKTYVSTHVASVVFNVPLVRDFNLRLGARAVTRTGIERSIRDGNSVLIVTGGQAEMMRTSCSSTEMHLVTYHHGFVRIAIKNRVPLVPALCFAENNVMNIMHFPRIQKLTLGILGFPFPLIPYGRWLLPLPNRTPLTLVLGKPITPKPDASPENADDVEELAKAYFEEIKSIFYKHREAAGYPNMELVLHNKEKKNKPVKETPKDEEKQPTNEVAPNTDASPQSDAKPE